MKFLHKSQVLMILMAAFLCGTVFASFVKTSRTVELIVVIAAIVILAFASYRGTFKQTPAGIRNRKIGALIGFTLLIFAFGIIRFNSFNSEKVALKEFSDREAGGKLVDTLMAGYVDGQIKVDGAKSNFPFKVKQIVFPERIIETDARVLIYSESFPRYEYGQKLAVLGGIKTPQNFTDTFDYVTYLKKEGIKALVSYPKISDKAELELGLVEKIRLATLRSILAIKNSFEGGIQKSIPEPNASLVNGVLFGSRQNIPEDIKEAFNKTGTTHILAISGYNIAILATIVLWALTFWFRRRKAFWISVAIIILFTVLTGASASVVRAAIMGLLLLFASGYGRLYDSRNAILLAATLMVLINPLVLIFDIGFQLSFLAVIGLMYVYPVLESRTQQLPRPGGLKEILLMTLAAQITVAPLIAFYFGQVSAVSLPANLLILPFVPAVMLGGFVAGVGGLIFAHLGQALGVFAWALTHYQIGVVRFFESLPFAAAAIGLSWHGMIIVYGFIWIVIRKLTKV